MEEGRPLGWRDLAVPAALLLLGAVELALLGSPGWLAAVGLEALAAGALAFRRRYPAVAVPASALLLMGIPWTGTRMEDAATPIFFYVLGMYTLARYLRLLGGLLLAALTLALVMVDFIADPDDNDVTDAMFVFSLAVPPYAFGRITRRLAEQSRLLAEQSEQLRDQAVREERDRIARELHDVIAHSISAMVVQTAAAQDLVRTRPEHAAALLAQVSDVGRTALAETGRLLHLIRDDADELGLRPVPGLGELPELVATHRRGGLEVDADLTLPERQLAGGVDVTAYRVVQEALTNAQRHGGGGARLVVAADHDRLRIHCSNPVNGTPHPGSGLGLLGMAERVGMLGGSLRHTLEADRFEVEAEIPLSDPGVAT